MFTRHWKPWGFGWIGDDKPDHRTPLYGLLIGAIALFTASIADSSATAAIITFPHHRVVGARFHVAGQPVSRLVCTLSLTQVLRPSAGLFSVGLIVGVVA